MLPVRPFADAQLPKRFDIKSGQFRFRTAQASDASDDIAAWMAIPSIVDGLNMSGQQMNANQLRGWIGGFDNIRRNLVLILTAGENVPAGFLMFDVEPRHRIGSFHLMIAHGEHRIDGGGLAGGRIALEHLFEARGVGKVSMEPLSRNRTVIQSCEWLGFRLEGLLKSHRLDIRTGERLDQHIFGMTKEEYHVWPWRIAR